MGSLTLNGATSGQITLNPPAVAGTNTLTLPAATTTLVGQSTTDTLTNKTLASPTFTGTATAATINATTIQIGGNLAVNGPAFSAYQSSAQTLSANTWTKIQFQTEEFDTNSNFDNTTNYRFTPTIAGYYQISGGFLVSTTITSCNLAVYKNGANFKWFNALNASVTGGFGSTLIYFNGSTDYVELYAQIGAGQALSTGASNTYFQGVMVRGA